MRQQAEIAIDHATVIVFLCDIKTGLTASDQEVANMLLRSGKPVVLAVNKMDQVGMTNPDIYEFYNLGLGDPIAVSAVHGHGTGDLLDECFRYFPPEDEEEEEDDVIKVAVIGKPNVGKSSLVNRILGEERVIVSDMAGTTRDAVDSYFENAKGKYLFIDTAGMRKKAKVDDRIEKFSVLRATMAIERCDVCLIMIDAGEGVTEQDTKVAGLAHEAGKACIIVVNKWDAIEKDDKTMDRMRQDVRRDLAYMTYAPIVFISALTGQRVDRLFDLINYVSDQAAMRITTGMLNTVLADATARVQPPTDKGRRLKIYYMTQIGVKPPHFVCFCNDAKLFHFSYQRYLENQIRATFGLEGTPIKLTMTWADLAPWMLSDLLLPLVIVAVAAYFCGCFNGAVIVSKYILRDDVRTHGSGNAGLTNFYRTFGGPLTFAVILTDVLKAVVAVWVGILVARYWDGGFWNQEAIVVAYGKYWAGTFCLLGHMFPCMFHFKGGKGILSGGTIAIMIDWRIALVVWGGFLILAVLTRWVSLGSIWAGASFPFATWFVYHDWILLLLGIFIGGLIVWKHRGNLKRILSGTESRFTLHHKKDEGASKP